jgi:hypothetical protein
MVVKSGQAAVVCTAVAPKSILIGHLCIGAIHFTKKGFQPVQQRKVTASVGKMRVGVSGS